METQIQSLENLIISKILKESPKNSSGAYDFNSLAKEIMNKIYIYNGAYEYHPIEIEFYIYDKVEHPDTHVYPRDKKEAGELLFHLSGIDICFDSSLEQGRFGGILIRALEREKDGEIKLFGGPLVCKDEILNTATEKCSVMFCEKKITGKTPHTSPRQGINEDKKIQDTFWNKDYRFIRGDIDIEKPIERFADTFAFKTTPPKESRQKRIYSLKYLNKIKD